MVKHGKDKKRRAGRYGRVKLKNKNFRRWNPKPKISDPVVKEHWDPSKSPTVNLANMGLRAKPNHADGKVSPTDNSKVIELFDIPESDKLNKPKKMPLCEQDQQYIAKCLEKHGDDYHSMFMDTKTNKMQHTETRLRKMASRFLLLESDQRIVELPDKVKHLVSKS